MNNTVSPKQVNSIINEVDGIIAKAKVDAETAGNAFFGKMKNLWEDNNAVTCAKDINREMDSVIQRLAYSSNCLKDGVVNIANFYARQAGKPMMNAPHTNFNSAINASIISDTFDGDEYGFKDPSAINALLDDVNAFSLAMSKIKDETSSRLLSINAFGNPEIKSKLISAASDFGDSLIDTSKKIKMLAEQRINQASKDYQISDVGSYFTGSVNGGSSTLYTPTVHVVNSLAGSAPSVTDRVFNNTKTL